MKTRQMLTTRLAKIPAPQKQGIIVDLMTGV
jgi:hypothetical protein